MVYVYVLISYLFGSVPYGYIIAKLFKNIDIRDFGSGNPGATNVFRVAGPRLGVIVFALDCLKGFLPVIGATYFFGNSNYAVALLAGLAAIAGHIFTPFLKFRGGKGVATGTGVFLALLPLITLAGALVFLAVFLVGRYVSLSSIIAGVCVCALSWVARKPIGVCVFATATAILIIYTHRSNISRLLNGTENRFGNEDQKSKIRNQN